VPGKSLISFDTVGSIVNTLREVDVRPIRVAAESSFVMAILSRDLPLSQHFVDLLYRGLRAHDVPSTPVCGAFPLKMPHPIERVNIAVIVAREDTDCTEEQTLVRDLEKAGVRVLVCLVTAEKTPPPLRHRWLPASMVTVGDPIDDVQATNQLVNGILGLKTVDALALARHLPAFRERVSRTVIDDAALANAIYSVGSGLVEIYPLADIPLNVADMMVLTKNQALMGYRIALAMGLNADFRQIMPQLAAVVGSGFLLRQAARGLIGLIPGLGIIPKVGVAFAGTYATGEVIHRWCAFGERVDSRALKDLYDSAIDRGRTVARTLLGRYKKEKGLKK
jgi:uncharacterized protein (DUF697 family)